MIYARQEKEAFPDKQEDCLQEKEAFPDIRSKMFAEK